ncbi:MAG: L-histidine N(alpha)-methyltransferase [Vicinamibacterales bacterium]
MEHELLRANAADINARLGPLELIVELGPGSGGKLAALLRHRTRKTVSVQLVDVSTEALDQASRTLASERGVSVQLRRQTYGEGLMRLARSRHRGTTLVVFLGSNIGNFDAASADALLRGMRAAVRTGGAILLGTDFVKPESELLRAYDDPLGVTAAFNRNLLVRINR